MEVVYLELMKMEKRNVGTFWPENFAELQGKAEFSLYWNWEPGNRDTLTEFRLILKRKVLRLPLRQSVMNSKKMATPWYGSSHRCSQKAQDHFWTQKLADLKSQLGAGKMPYLMGLTC